MSIISDNSNPAREGLPEPPADALEPHEALDGMPPEQEPVVPSLLRQEKEEEAPAADPVTAETVADEADSGEPAPEAPPENRKRWYVVKVQSGREDTIKESIERRVRKEGLEEFFGRIVIPVEKITEVKTDKNGKRVTRTKDVKLYPGYLMVEVEYNDRMLYLFRETSGVGDFVGAHPGDLTRAPTPMSEKEVQKMLGPTRPGEKAPSDVATRPAGLEVGERVKVIDGTFNGMDGNIKQILEAVGKVQVELTIFGRPVNVDLDYYQVESI